MLGLGSVLAVLTSVYSVLLADSFFLANFIAMAAFIRAKMS